MTIDSGPNASDGTQGNEPQADAEPAAKGWGDLDRREALTKIGALASAAPARVVLLSASSAHAQLLSVGSGPPGPGGGI